MENSAMCPNFDPPMGFSQFLEEARQHAKSSETSSNQQGGGGGERRLGGEEEKKGKKSWKSKVFSWLRPGNKSKANNNKAEKEEGCGSSRPRRCYASGPIHGSRKKMEIKHQRPVSGPISMANLCNPTKRVDTEVPYMCLDSNLNSPKFQGQQGVKPFGPVYLVT